jgi:photosystem II stability/assembly factor-like uncharacterized protein
MRSVDGGASWLEVTSPLEFGSSVTLHAVTARHSNAAGAQLVWAVGEGGTVLRSSDNGRSFSRVSLPADYAAATLHDVAFATEEHGWIVGALGDSVLHTTNGASSSSCHIMEMGFEGVIWRLSCPTLARSALSTLSLCA